MTQSMSISLSVGQGKTPNLHTSHPLSGLCCQVHTYCYNIQWHRPKIIIRTFCTDLLCVNWDMYSCTISFSLHLSCRIVFNINKIVFCYLGFFFCIYPVRDFLPQIFCLCTNVFPHPPLPSRPKCRSVLAPGL